MDTERRERTGGHNTAPTSAHVAVIGGGVAGLAAGYYAAAAGARVSVFEGSPRPGGKLRVSEIAGIPVDEGAEAMLARRPEGLELAERVGLGGRLVHPGTTAAGIWSRGRLRPLPQGQVMGVPADLAALARADLLSPRGLLRVPLDLVLPRTRPPAGAAAEAGADVSVARHVGSRLGRELVDRLVEPLLGGVYAGRVEELSFAATLPAVAAHDHRSLIAAARAVQAAAPAEPGPLFATLRGGLGALPGALVNRITAAGGAVRTSATVRELRRTPRGWRLTVGPTRAPERVDADAVIVAVPARPAGRLLDTDVPAAAAELARIDYASMAIVTLAYAGRPPSRASGYLVPAVEPGEVKAVTFSSVKWPHLADGHGPTVVRCSIGRYGEEHVLQRSDEDLVAAAAAELARTCAMRTRPVATRVTRWGGGLPQYTVGHLARVARIRAAVAAQPGLAVCGAAYDGLGVPACVSTARAAADRVIAYLDRRGDDG
jgi:oxygen-dependent protoporphyrinogen oxidase